MTTVALLALAGFAGATPDTVRVAGCPGGQALERADLEGLVLVDDVLGRLDGVAWASIDGFDRRPWAGAAPVGGAPWLVTIDGVPADPGAFGSVEMHLLPVQPSEIDRVEYCPGPGLAAGRFAGAGVLAITTRRPAAIEAEAGARIANESGDPGPRRYLPGAAPNVDKIGPDIAIGAAGPLWAVGGRFEKRYPSDPFAIARNAAALGAFPAVRYGAGGLHAGRPGGRLRFDGAATYASDLWFLERAGRELPVLRLGAQGAVTAGATIGGLVAGGRATAAVSRVDRRPEMPDSVLSSFSPDWDHRSATVDLEVRPRRPRPRLVAGVHARAFQAFGTGVGDGTGGLVRVWVSRRGDAGRGWTRRGDIAVLSDGDLAGLEAALMMQRAWDQGALALTVARDDRLPAEEGGLAFWAGRGYTGANGPAVTYSPSPMAGRATEWSLRVDGSATAGRGVRARASAWVRDFRGLALDDASFRPDSLRHVAGSVALATGRSGIVLTSSLGADGGTEKLSWGGSYRLERAVGGDAEFRSAWSRVPVHLLRAHGSVRPDPSLLVRLSIEARSGTRWGMYSAFGGAPVPGLEETYRADLPGAILVDLDVQKSILDEHVLLTLSARNLTNATERTHPLGATLAFRLWVGGALRF
jgi:hypothetical protein